MEKSTLYDLFLVVRFLDENSKKISAFSSFTLNIYIYYPFQNRRWVIVSWITKDMWKKETFRLAWRRVSGKSLQNRRAKDRRHDEFFIQTIAFDAQESSLQFYTNRRLLRCSVQMLQSCSKTYESMLFCSIHVSQWRPHTFVTSLIIVAIFILSVNTWEWVKNSVKQS